MAHVATRWQVRLQSDPDWSTPLINYLTSNPAELLTYTPTGLDPLTAYFIRAALVDSVDGQGSFSSDVPFLTLAENTEPEPPPPTEWVPASEVC